MLNKVMLIGNLGSDPEVRYTPSGACVCNFNVATTENWTKDGEKQSHTEWHKVNVWSKLAEICGEYLSKGKKVYVEGTLRTNEWEDSEGNKRKSVEVRARNVIFLSNKSEVASSPKVENDVSSPKLPGSDFEDDIPF